MALPAFLRGRFLPGRLRRAGSELARLHDAIFGDDARDVLRRRHVERRVAGRALFRGDRMTVEVQDFLRRPLLDWDLVARCQVEIDRARWCRDVERYPVLLRDHGLPVRADLVRGVAVRRDSIRADEDEIHLAAAEERGCRAARDDRVVDPLLEQLPRGEACALEPWARLVDVDEEAAASFLRDAQRRHDRAVIDRREGARVAMRQDADPVPDQLCSVLAILRQRSMSSWAYRSAATTRSSPDARAFRMYSMA